MGQNMPRHYNYLQAAILEKQRPNKVSKANNTCLGEILKDIMECLLQVGLLVLERF